MRSHDPDRVRPQPGGARTDIAWECLSGVARILAHCGNSPQDLVSAMRKICGSLKLRRRGWDPAQLGFLPDLSHVIAHWHSDPRYLSTRGEPVPLPLRGRNASLTGLIKRALPGEDPRVVVQTLVRTRGIRRRAGHYIPTDRYVRLRGDWGRVHGANALLRMLRTVEHNLASPASSQIFERAAINPHFPVAKLPAFHRDVSTRAYRFLVGIDGNMRRQEARATGGPRTRVGVEVVVFEEALGANETLGVTRRAQHITSRRRRTRRRKP